MAEKQANKPNSAEKGGAMPKKLLEIKNVSKIFRIGGMLMGKKLVAIDDVSLEIDAG